jgi:putative sigma-54 modulation protein
LVHGATIVHGDPRIDPRRPGGQFQQVRRRTMQFKLSGQKIDITAALRSHAEAKLDRLTRLDDRIVSLNVVLSVDKLQQCAEGTLNVAGKSLHAEASETDMYVSIDNLFDMLVTQLRRHREKLCDKHQREVREIRQYG